ELVDLADVRVIEARDELALVEEHRDVRGRRDELGQQALDDDGLLEPGLAGEPREMDLGHAAGRELTDQLIPAELRRVRCHAAVSMPRTLTLCAVLSSGCLFSADYGGGQYTCKDGRCPSGLSCVSEK